MGETKNRIERAAKLMAHAGEEIRFGEIGFLRRGFGAFQLDVCFLEGPFDAFALGDVTRSGEYALQLPIPVVEGGCVVGYDGCFAVPRTGDKFIVGDLFST